MRRTGVNATAISVKSQSSQNISPTMKTMVMRSIMISSVDDDAKSWMVATSLGVIEITQGQPVQMLVDPKAQIVGDPLADAGRIVVVDIARERANNRDGK